MAAEWGEKRRREKEKENLYSALENAMSKDFFLSPYLTQKTLWRKDDFYFIFYSVLKKTHVMAEEIKFKKSLISPKNGYGEKKKCLFGPRKRYGYRNK